MPLNNEEPPSKEHPTIITIIRCVHDVPPTIRGKLGRFAICPSCTVDYRIKEIREVQADLRQRDGIFASKTNLNSIGGLKHKGCTRSWVKAKVYCYRDIQNLENLRKSFPEQSDQWGVLEALDKWEQLQDEAARVPGYKYVQDSLDEPEEEEEAVLIPSPKGDRKPDVAVGTSIPLTPQERNDLLKQDREWCFVTPKRKAKKRRVVHLTEAVESMSEELSSTQIGDAASLDEDVLTEMDDVTKRLDQRLAMGSFDLFDAIVGVEFSPTQQSDGYEAPHNEQTTLPTPPSPTPPSIARLPVAQPGRSALKEQSTILGDLEHPLINEPHRKHTAAGFAHKRANFHRTNRFYNPGTWTSPEGSEKHDTSFMSMSWPGYEKNLRELPTVNKNGVFMEVENIDPKLTLESEVRNLINEARDRRVEVEKNEDGNDALVAMPATNLFKIEINTEQIDGALRSTATEIGESPPISKQRVREVAILIIDNETKAEGSLSRKRQIDGTASEAQPPTPPPAMAENKTKGRKVKKPN
ncbi:hypothetical protein SNOG_11450 [Parastagonospora nodorum SN15]|uniref:Uncharacterized protein n=1 Tax=Phaeosphaeria nodorum (strain SN15 / ATCC MYA-4574 / FGSC 10173) TaxID=321614 RepID=Q0U9W4_PHANO|nr:hypothetical protein SNOG_11450 [Parastagonospora nodorum SN15]EAT81158.2 hypothetical protein SNOG_11450 [Parastagonospora nodorum SN15]